MSSPGGGRHSPATAHHPSISRRLHSSFIPHSFIRHYFPPSLASVRCHLPQTFCLYALVGPVDIKSIAMIVKMMKIVGCESMIQMTATGKSCMLSAGPSGNFSAPISSSTGPTIRQITHTATHAAQVAHTGVFVLLAIGQGSVQPIHWLP